MTRALSAGKLTINFGVGSFALSDIARPPSRLRLARPLGGAVLAVLLSGCAVQPEPLISTELVALARSDREAMFAFSPLPQRSISPEEAMARALKFNLDRRVKLMEEALAFDQTKLDRFDLLPWTSPVKVEGFSDRICESGEHS